MKQRDPSADATRFRRALPLVALLCAGPPAGAGPPGAAVAPSAVVTPTAALPAAASAPPAVAPPAAAQPAGASAPPAVAPPAAAPPARATTGPAGLRLPRQQASDDWRAPLDASAPIGVFIAAGEDVPGFHEGDPELARWALEAWERAAAGGFHLHDAPRERALLHLYWVSGANGLYGEMRPFLRGEERGAAVFVLPDTAALGREIARRAAADPLFRDTVVYLTCLHELGHAFGLAHTADFDDIMYSFRYGGDIPYYFQRYRDRLRTRADIERVSGLSDNDVRRLRALYPAR